MLRGKKLLYEYRANEQDFFCRSIEPAKTSGNSVIYGGSNTVLSRAALEKIGGFYTESITEDFATGLLIESAGFVSLGLPTPLASDRPRTYLSPVAEHRSPHSANKAVSSAGAALRLNAHNEKRETYCRSPVFLYGAAPGRS